MPYNYVFNFFQNLDALHDHLATIYPGMRAPSFRCTDAEKGKGLILHYYSEREGLQDIVIGIIKTVAQQIHGTEIDMKVMSEAIQSLKIYISRKKPRKSEVKWWQTRVIFTVAVFCEEVESVLSGRVIRICVAWRMYQPCAEKASSNWQADLTGNSTEQYPIIQKRIVKRTCKEIRYWLIWSAFIPLYFLFGIYFLLSTVFSENTDICSLS